MVTTTASFRIPIIIGDNGEIKLATDKVNKLGAAVKGAGKNTSDANKASGDFFDTQKKGIIGTGNSTKSFSKLAETLGGNSSGIVGAYATLAANIFAVTAAFNAFRGAAQVEQILRGLEAAGTRTGQSLVGTAAALRQVSGDAISAEQSMRSTAQIISAGFNEKTVIRLGQAAKDASFALGRNMTDSLDRLSRGIVKLEPELLDELGIMTKLTESNVNYARTLGKSESQLTNFEKRQGFANAVLAEAELKFGGLSAAAGDATAYDKLAASFTDLTNKVFNFGNIIGKPIAGVLTSSLLSLAGVGVLFASTLKNQLIPGLAQSATKYSALAKLAKDDAVNKLNEVENIKKLAAEQNSLNLANKENIQYAGTRLPKFYQENRAEIMKTIGSTNELTAAQRKGMNSLAASIRANRAILENNPNYAKGTDTGNTKRDEQAALIREQRAVEALSAARRTAATFDAENDSRVAAARRTADSARLKAVSAEAGAASIGAASQLKLGVAWKELSSSVSNYAAAQRAATGQGLTSMALLRTAVFATATGVKALGTAFLAALPYIGAIIFAAGLLRSAWEATKSDAVKALEKAVADLGEATRKANEFGQELVRISISQASASLRTAAAITVQANAISNANDKYQEYLAAQLNSNAADAVTTSETANTVASFWESLGTRSALSYIAGLKRNTQSLNIAEYLQEKSVVGLDTGQLSENSLAAVQQLNLLEQSNKKAFDSAIEARGGIDAFGKSLQAMSSTQVTAAVAKLSAEIAKLTDGNAEKVKDFQEAFKNLGNSIADFNRANIPTTPYDNLVKSFASAKKSALDLQATLDPKQFTALLSGLDSNSVRTLNISTQKDIEEYNKADAIVQQIIAKRAELKKGESLSVTDQRDLAANQAILNSRTELGKRITDEIGQRLKLVQQAQEDERIMKSQLTLLNAQMQANSRIYAAGAAGMKAKIDAEERSRKLQVSALETQINVSKTISGNLNAQIVSLEVDKQKLELIKKQLEAQTQLRNQSALATQDQVAAQLRAKQIDPATAALFTQDKEANSLLSSYRALGTVISETTANAQEMAKTEAEIAGITAKQEGLRAEARDVTQQIVALQNQIKTILTENLDPQQKAALLAEAQRQYYSNLLGTITQQAKALTDINDIYYDIDATIAGTNNRLEYQMQQLTRRAAAEKADLARNNIGRQAELQGQLVTAQAELNREKREGNKVDIQAAESLVQYARNALSVSETELNIANQRIDAGLRQALVEKTIFDTRKEGLEWQQDSLSLLQKQIDAQRSLAEETDRTYELQLKLRAARTGIAITSYGDEAMEIRSAATAYKYALEEVEVKKGLIDLEYALLEAQRENTRADLAARRQFLATQEGAEDQVAQLDSILSRLDRVDLSKAAETAKNTVERQLANARSTLELAMEPKNSYSSVFTELIGVSRDIDERRKQAANAVTILEQQRQKAETAIVAKKRAEDVKAAPNPLIEVNKNLITKIQEWINAITKVNTGNGAQPVIRNSLTEAAGYATRNGFRVSEMAGYGGVTSGVHKGQGHNDGRAFDLNIGTGNVEANNPEMKQRMDKLASYYREQGFKVLWNTEGHFNHMHVEISKAAQAAFKSIDTTVSQTAQDMAESADEVLVTAPKKQFFNTKPEDYSMSNSMADYQAPDFSGVEVTKTPTDFKPLETSLSKIGPTVHKIIDDMAALGPEGEAVSKVMAGMENMGSSVITALKVMENGSKSTGEKFAAVAGAISSALGVAGAAMAAQATMKEAAIDREIAAEQKRDGKSAGSVQKIAELEKKKDTIARKAFETNKKIQMAQAVLSTAAGIAMALANPFPYNLIAAGITAAAGAVQLAVIAGTSYQSTASTAATTSTPSQLTIGKSGDSVDLAKQNSNVGGELGYLRGKQGTGTNSANYSVIGSAYGGELPRGYGNSAYVVGEKGPETIIPTAAMTVRPANDNGAVAPINPTFHINTIDASGVEEILLGQKGNLISMFREAANANGKGFMEDVNVSNYSRPNTANRL